MVNENAEEGVSGAEGVGGEKDMPLGSSLPCHNLENVTGRLVDLV